ncbi:PilZ domain-containing protein [Simiduia sp. 21SJ11W-1]|uniref:PilZ domain-containing protein n=1 Tax=Simiduia sp. 21SJ11W-1 TaxID=2909669 RepID=UPI00209E2006|nr:PilZ domain-containing protein [Simiduia sp. 21SJ11W-1]UTA49407.1 PilZ domain-containing protein [Simiduia sp. 21SJ11W-1]
MARQSTPEDQREAFRIQERVALHAVVTNNTEKPAAAHFPEFEQLHTLTEFTRLGLELQALIGSLESSVAHALRLQDKRLDLLANALAAEHTTSKQQTVSISTNGLAFEQADALPLNTCLALAITFVASHFTLFNYAKVVRCDAKGTGWLIGCEFLEQADSDQQLLGRHIISAQRRSRS